jgi:hypothetical protein
MVVLPGHEDLDVARVVEHYLHFLVVEKLGNAAEVATELESALVSVRSRSGGEAVRRPASRSAPLPLFLLSVLETLSS